jgi:MOSC domain-containing protein YiiM
MACVSGKLIGVYAGSQKGAGKTAVESVELIAGYGVQGDAHAGQHPDRQISLFEGEVLRELAAEGIDVSAEALSANLVTEHIPLSKLNPGTRLSIGQAIIELTAPRRPCASLTKLDRRLPKRLYQRCGMLGRIIRGGTVSRNQTIEVLSQTGTSAAQEQMALPQ